MSLMVACTYEKKPKLIADYLSDEDDVYILGSGNWKWIKNLDDIMVGMLSHASLHYALKKILRDEEFNAVDVFFAFDNLFSEKKSIRKWIKYPHGLFGVE